MKSFSVEYSVTEKGRKSPKYSIDTDLSGEITLAELSEFTRANLIIISDQVLREEQGKGFDKTPVTLVDGRRNKPVANVHPLGKIEFIARGEMKDAILKTYQAILDRSPVLTGRYKRSHYVFLNGKQVATDLTSLTAWLATNPTFQAKDLIRIVNIQPYARKLERYGNTAQRKKIRTQKSRDKRQRSGARILAPNGAYYLAFRSAHRLFKHTTGIRFGFLSGHQMGLMATFKNYSKASGVRKDSKSKKSTYLYPTITFYVSEFGAT